MQRPEGEIGLFRSNLTPETASLGEFGRHVFEVRELSRVCHTLYNLRVWMVETEWIELVTPHPIIEPVSLTTASGPNFTRADTIVKALF